MARMASGHDAQVDTQLPRRFRRAERSVEVPPNLGNGIVRRAYTQGEQIHLLEAI